MSYTPCLVVCMHRKKGTLLLYRSSVSCSCRGCEQRILALEWPCSCCSTAIHAVCTNRLGPHCHDAVDEALRLWNLWWQNAIYQLLMWHSSLFWAFHDASPHVVPVSRSIYNHFRLAGMNEFLPITVEGPLSCITHNLTVAMVEDFLAFPLSCELHYFGVVYFENKGWPHWAGSQILLHVHIKDLFA